MRPSWLLDSWLCCNAIRTLARGAAWLGLTPTRRMESGQHVPATCPLGGATADSHGLSRSACQQTRRPADPQVVAEQRHRVPKLIVRVRFPSPAPE